MTPPASTARQLLAGAPPQTGKRALSAVQWLLPVLFLFWVWRYALRCWFIADDFAWLNLLGSVHNFRDFLRAMFTPMAQGTIRPWSERGFFMLFDSLFGLNSLPWRLCVFVTAAADIFLISRLALRLTRSRVAGFLAPVLWIANAALTDPLCWTSVYNELLCPLFLLSALLLFIQWADTGRAAWWWWQVAVFSLGFGALEINIVYPALALSLCAVVYPSARRRNLLPGILPLFLISAIYFLVHRAAAPIPKGGVYALHFDRRIFSTLALYWKWTMLPANWPAIGIGRHAAQAGMLLLSAAFAAGVAAGIRGGHREIFFGPLWYLITLAPLLPLFQHRSDYYLTIPVIGLAITGAQAFLFASRSAWKWRVPAILAVAIYLAAMVRMDGIAAHWWYDRDRPIRAVVLGVAQARENHPAKAIVLDGVTDDIYNDAIAHSAFRSVGVGRVYLTPASADTIHAAFDPGLLERVVMEPPVLRRALLDDAAVIYSVTANHLRNVTEAFRRRADEFPEAAPRRIDVGDPLFAFALGPEWGPVESGFRRIPARASLRLGAPGNRHFLVLEGRYEAANPGAAGPHLTVLLDSVPVGETRLNGSNGNFYRLFNLPAAILQNRARDRGLNVEVHLQDSSTPVSQAFLGTVALE